MQHNEKRVVKPIAKLVLMGCLVVVCGIMGEIYHSPLMAHEAEGANLYAGMKHGVVDVVTERMIRINRVDYGLAVDVEITDQYQRQVSLKNLDFGQNVYFRVDHKNMITKVVVLIPS